MHQIGLRIFCTVFHTIKQFLYDFQTDFICVHSENLALIILFSSVTDPNNFAPDPYLDPGSGFQNS